MATLSLKQVTKVFDNGVEAVKDFDLDVGDGEFVVLVGPSGCGKTTVLRMVAGLEDISAGTISLDGAVANELSPRDRDVAMIFQNYALYPHLNVHQNIGFSLSVRRVPKEERDRRVAEAAELLGLTELLTSKPRQLSGGQRQRVAMGRALVRDPAVFLMDEPLSNLDASLRVRMRTEVLHIQRRLGVATLYVTHDQTEAMTMGDRVAVMRAGVLQQLAPPHELYERPANVFVASFMGSPSMNLYRVPISARDDKLEMSLGSQTLSLPADIARTRPQLVAAIGSELVVGIRPEDLAPAADHNGEASTPMSHLVVDVELVEALGNEQLVHFATDASRFHDKVQSTESDQETDGVASRFAGTGSGKGVARVDPRVRIVAGARITLALDLARLHFFDPHTGLALGGASL